MDYLVTFEDGTNGYLAHHGIKGMQWGRWNAETRARYTGSGRGKRAIKRADNKVNKAWDKYDRLVDEQNENSYEARSAAHNVRKKVERREYLVEKNRPGHGNIDPNRFNELRSNERVKRSALIGAVGGGVGAATMGSGFVPFMAAYGAVSMTAGSSALSTSGKRAVMDVLRGRETYRLNSKSDRYENTMPWGSESRQTQRENPVRVKGVR